MLKIEHWRKPEKLHKLNWLMPPTKPLPESTLEIWKLKLKLVSKPKWVPVPPRLTFFNQWDKLNPPMLNYQLHQLPMLNLHWLLKLLLKLRALRLLLPQSPLQLKLNQLRLSLPLFHPKLRSKKLPKKKLRRWPTNLESHSPTIFPNSDLTQLSQMLSSRKPLPLERLKHRSMPLWPPCELFLII